MSLKGGVRFLVKQVLGGARMLKPGDPAPDFDVLDHNGNRVKLTDQRGKKVVLWFYPKADTPG
jgi:peroxiredoxin